MSVQEELSSWTKDAVLERESTPDLSARFSSVKERVQKAEPKGSTPQSEGKAFRHLAQGT